MPARTGAQLERAPAGAREKPARSWAPDRRLNSGVIEEDADQVRARQVWADLPGTWMLVLASLAATE
jgi:hypothetical protein